MSDSYRPHGLQPTRLLCPWHFPGKSTGMGCHCLFWLSCSVMSNLCDPMDCNLLSFSASSGELPDRGIEPGSLAFLADSLPAELPGKPLYVSCFIVMHFVYILFIPVVTQKVSFQTHPGRQASISSGSKEPRSALESRRVSLGAHWVD